jgi:hypothetical protein
MQMYCRQSLRDHRGRAKTQLGRQCCHERRETSIAVGLYEDCSRSYARV